MMDRLAKSIRKQRDNIEYILLDPLSLIADICAEYWNDRSKLDIELMHYLDINTGHRCRMLYAIDMKGLQHSGNISDAAFDETRIGQDLSNRPYLHLIEKVTINILCRVTFTLISVHGNPVSQH